MISKIRDISTQLQAAYPKDEAEALAWWIAEETTGLSRSQLLCGYKGTTNFPHMQEIISRLLHFEPIQYIFGHTLWCGLDLKVSPATLIPRPETAELIDRIQNTEYRIQTDHPFRVLDIGTGSGCIAIALKKTHPEWQVTGLDISTEALEIAKENAQKNGVEVVFKQLDIFSDEIEKNHQSPITNHQYDLVVSNPPYICEKEKIEMRRNVLDYEPATALFVPDEDPLLFYRRIAQLRIGKYLFFEINEAYAKELKEMLSQFGYTDIQITNDIYGKPRIIDGRMVG